MINGDESGRKYKQVSTPILLVLVLSSEFIYIEALFFVFFFSPQFGTSSCLFAAVLVTANSAVGQRMERTEI